MNFRKAYPGLVSAALTFLALAAGKAAPVTFTTEAAFVESLGPHAIESFETPVDFDGVSVTFTHLSVTEVGPAPGSGFFDSTVFVTDGSFGLALNLDAGSSIVFDLNAESKAFGFHFHNPLSLGVSVTLVNGIDGSITVPTGENPSFFGVTTDGAFSRVVVAPTAGSNGEFLVFDQVYVEMADTPIPEPSTLALTTLGVAGIGFYKRRRARADRRAAR